MGGEMTIKLPQLTQAKPTTPNNNHAHDLKNVHQKHVDNLLAPGSKVAPSNYDHGTAYPQIRSQSRLQKFSSNMTSGGFLRETLPLSSERSKIFTNHLSNNNNKFGGGGVPSVTEKDPGQVSTEETPSKGPLSTFAYQLLGRYVHEQSRDRFVDTGKNHNADLLELQNIPSYKH